MILEEGGELPSLGSCNPFLACSRACCLHDITLLPCKPMPFICAEQRQRDKAAAKALHDTLQRTSIQEDAESPDQQEPVAPQAELHQEVRQLFCAQQHVGQHSSLDGVTCRAECGSAPQDLSCLIQACG